MVRISDAYAYSRRGSHANSAALIMAFCSILLLHSCTAKQKTSDQLPLAVLTFPKQKGAHVFSRIDSTDVQFLKKNHITWITLVPWGFQEDITSPVVNHGATDSARVAEHNEHWVRQIKEAKASGFHVFLKPHLWIDAPSEGKWRSDIFQETESDRTTWRDSYSAFILRYASVAETAGADMFCIGAEFTRLTREFPEYWIALIENVRSVFSGQLTYAANWYEEYEHVSFWSELDAIGVQAYFPLTDELNPSLEQVKAGWESYLPTLESVSNTYQKPIVFTELGYKSSSNAAIEPWVWEEHLHSSEENSYSAETQVNCYEAFFQCVWNKPWMGGVHLWQFRGDYERNPRGIQNLDFTPQGKPAERVIREEFK